MTDVSLSWLDKYCHSLGYSSGQMSFPLGSAFQCVGSSTIETGQEYSFSGGVSVGGVEIGVGTTFSASQSYSCDATNKKCKFWISYAQAVVRKWDCTRQALIYSWDNPHTIFKPGDGTVICCCEAVSCADGGGDGDGGSSSEMSFDGGVAGLPPLEGRISMVIDLAEYFTTSGPTPGHPLAGPHDAATDLTEWHFAQLQSAADLAGFMDGEDVQEIVIFDADGTPHFYPLDADPFPFWGAELSQASLAMTPMPGVGCFTGSSPPTTSATAVARSYDLSTIPALAGKPYAINAVVVGVQTNSGSPLNGTVSIYIDSDGGAPLAPGLDLVLAGSKNIIMPTSPLPYTWTAAFDAPIIIPAGATFVAELSYLAHADSILVPGVNPFGQSAPSYIRAAECGWTTFTDLASLGFGGAHLVQVVVGESVMVCPADLDGNGAVNGLDLASLLAAWTGLSTYPSCPPFAPADQNQDCKVNGLDLAALLAAWGPC